MFDSDFQLGRRTGIWTGNGAPELLDRRSKQVRSHRAGLAQVVIHLMQYAVVYLT